jgi:hypothetical protein
VRHFLEKTMFDDRPSADAVDLFAAESGRAAICYVFDSLRRAISLNHTTHLSLPQQAQMTLLSLFALLDLDDTCRRRGRAIACARLNAESADSATIGLDLESIAESAVDEWRVQRGH